MTILSVQVIGEIAMVHQTELVDAGHNRPRGTRHANERAEYGDREKYCSSGAGTINVIKANDSIELTLSGRLERQGTCKTLKMAQGIHLSMIRPSFVVANLNRGRKKTSQEIFDWFFMMTAVNLAIETAWQG